MIGVDSGQPEGPSCIGNSGDEKQGRVPNDGRIDILRNDFSDMTEWFSVATECVTIILIFLYYMLRWNTPMETAYFRPHLSIMEFLGCGGITTLVTIFF